MGRPLIDMKGKRCGRLTVLERAEDTPSGRPRWRCRCDCGAVTLVTGRDLRGNRIKSCGCWRRERTARLGITNPPLKHAHARGGAKTSTYTSWIRMKQRCDNPKSTGYQYWGGRGISVCERWQSFENFLADMGERPEGKTIDRWPDNNGNYEPGNCRWATPKEQRHNRRDAA